jgi:hypothetical protein
MADGGTAARTIAQVRMINAAASEIDAAHQRVLRLLRSHPGPLTPAEAVAVEEFEEAAEAALEAIRHAVSGSAADEAGAPR